LEDGFEDLRILALRELEHGTRADLVHLSFGHWMIENILNAREALVRRAAISLGIYFTR